MRLSRNSLRVASFAAFGALVPLLAQAAPPKKAKANAERAAGVIIKAEKAGDHGALKISINTNAVWRDWARDQVNDKPADSAAKDADAGKNSVATVGEPADANSLVVVTVAPDAKVETRFRVPDDEASDGVKAPGADASKAGKPVRFGMKDLKAGLFVAVDFDGAGDRNAAKTVTVIRPIDDVKGGATKETAGSK